MRIDDALEYRLAPLWITELVLELSKFADRFQIYTRLVRMNVAIENMLTYACVSPGSEDYEGVTCAHLRACHA